MQEMLTQLGELILIILITGLVMTNKEKINKNSFLFKLKDQELDLQSLLMILTKPSMFSEHILKNKKENQSCSIPTVINKLN